MKRIMGIVALVTFCVMISGAIVLAQAPAAPAAQQKTITGVLVVKEGAMMLKSKAGEQALLGDVDKSLVGKKVVVTGTEETGADGKTSIKVEKVAAVKKMVMASKGHAPKVKKAMVPAATAPAAAPAAEPGK